VRLFIASLFTETNTFSPFPTGRRAFEENGVSKTASTDPPTLIGSPMGVLRRRGEAAGYQVLESLSAFAQPGGRTVRAVYENYRDIILSDLKAVSPVDMVILVLHGAMVADGYDDCEGDLLVHIRGIAPGAVIGVEIDPHCHLTEAMMKEADLIIPFKEYPHIDIDDRADELFELCDRTLRDEIRPVAALLDTQMIGFYPTLKPPMSEIVALLREIEREPGVLSASIGHGFPWGDVAETGTRVLVYADADAELASKHALNVAERLYALRHEFVAKYPSVAESLDRAASHNGRVVLGDHSDNAGGGAPSDSTYFLREMINRDSEHAVIGCFHDPAVAQMCADAGVGARLAIRLGGKSGPASGDPIDLEVEVMAVSFDHSQSVFGSRMGLGLAVWLRHRGVDILVNTVRSQPFDPDIFTGMGIDLDNKRLIVVKSSNHYEAGFGPIADQLWHVDSPGTLTLDVANLPYRLRAPYYFPRIDDPWSKFGKPVPIIFSNHRS
jgi:microcystin degradation protein MlrC